MSRDITENTIELEKCPRGGYNCHDLLVRVNELLHNANMSVKDKNYGRALELKEDAFNQVIALEQEQCQACGNLFREVILGSIKTYIADLKKMSRGLFGKRKYKYHLENALVLSERMEEYLDMYKSGSNSSDRSKKQG